MGATYTSRKGVRYHLNLGTTKTGKPRYYFAREPQGEGLPEIPPGYEIVESVNGVVSLAKCKPKLIHPGELEVVEAVLLGHPRAESYRAIIKDRQIEIHERVGGTFQENVDKMRDVFGDNASLMMGAQRLRNLQEDLDRRARYTPVMRFILADSKTRTFAAERRCYRGNLEWLPLLEHGDLRRLVQSLIPKLGTEAFFELF